MKFFKCQTSYQDIVGFKTTKTHCKYNCSIHSAFDGFRERILRCMDFSHGFRCAWKTKPLLSLLEISVSWRKKHIECDCDFLWETIRDGAIIAYRVTSDKLTAILSNAFTNLTCISIRDPCGLIDIHLSTVNGWAQNDGNAKWTIFVV